MWSQLFCDDLRRSEDSSRTKLLLVAGTMRVMNESLQSVAILEERSSAEERIPDYGVRAAEVTNAKADASRIQS